MFNMKNTPAITYIMIDTENKSKKQLIDEVVDKVDKILNTKLLEYKGIIGSSEYELVVKDMEAERSRMISQFVYQIMHLDERANLEGLVGIQG